jgi:hypothetical protein
MSSRLDRRDFLRMGLVGAGARAIARSLDTGLALATIYVEIEAFFSPNGRSDQCPQP